MSTFKVKVECNNERDDQTVEADTVSEAFNKLMDMYPKSLVDSERVVIIGFTRSN